MTAAAGGGGGSDFMFNLLPAPLSPLEDFIKAVANRKPTRAVEAVAKMKGMPYAQPRRTIRGAKTAVEKKDPRYLIWSKYAMEGRPWVTRRKFIKEQLNVAEFMTPRMLRRKMELDFKLAVAQGIVKPTAKGTFNQDYYKAIEKQRGPAVRLAVKMQRGK